MATSSSEWPALHQAFEVSKTTLSYHQIFWEKASARRTSRLSSSRLVISQTLQKSIDGFGHSIFLIVDDKTKIVEN